MRQFHRHRPVIAAERSYGAHWSASSSRASNSRLAAIAATPSAGSPFEPASVSRRKPVAQLGDLHRGGRGHGTVPFRLAKIYLTWYSLTPSSAANRLLPRRADTSVS